MDTRKQLALLALASTALAAVSCSIPDNCPVCGTTTNGPVVAITTMEVPHASPYGYPFVTWDIVTIDPDARRLYVTDRSATAIDVYDTSNDLGIGQIGGGMFVGALCCEPDRVSNFNELSGPNATVIATTPNFPGKQLWVSNGDSTLKVFDLTTDLYPRHHLQGVATQTYGTIHTGAAFQSVYACGAALNGLGTFPEFTNPCGDLRADEMAYDPDHHVVLVSNGDGGGTAQLNGAAFITLADANDPYCNGKKGPSVPADNSCVIAQVFFDGNAGTSASSDTNFTGCPVPALFPQDPKVATDPVNGSGVTDGNRVKCRHGPLTTDGIGGSTYNPKTGKFLVPMVSLAYTDSNGTFINDHANAEITEVDPLTGKVTNHFNKALKGQGCLPSSLVIGPSNNLLVGCANREGQAFPANTLILDATTGDLINVIYEVGRADQVTYNPGDHRFYISGRDMPNGSVLGIIDADTNQWLMNAPTGGNAHSVATDPNNNHIYVPLGVNPRCGKFSSEGCVAVYVSQ